MHDINVIESVVNIYKVGRSHPQFRTGLNPKKLVTNSRQGSPNPAANHVHIAFNSLRTLQGFSLFLSWQHNNQLFRVFKLRKIREETTKTLHV